MATLQIEQFKALLLFTAFIGAATCLHGFITFTSRPPGWSDTIQAGLTEDHRRAFWLDEERDELEVFQSLPGYFPG